MIKNITLGNMSNIIKCTFLNILASISNLIPFIALAKMVETLFLNRLSSSIDTNSLWKYFWIMAVFFFVTFFLENIATKYTYELGYRASADGRIVLADHIRNLPMGYLLGKSSSEILDSLMNDFFKVETAITHQLPQFFSGICVAILCSILFLIVDIKMGVAALIGLPVAFILLRFMQASQKKLYLRKKNVRIKEEEDIYEYLDTIKTLKAYDSLDNTLTKLEKDIDDSKNINIKSEKGIGYITTIASMILRIGLPLMSITGSYLFINGTLEINTFLMFLFVGTRIFDPLELALANYTGLQMAAVSGERILNLLDTKPMSGNCELNNHSNIEIKNLSFSYKDSKVIDDVTLDINENELTAFVGYSGSGKSTLIKLISRFYDPDNGFIKIGGVDLITVDPSNLMDKFSVVFQDVYLFKDTIYNNIKFGNENASKNEVINAAKMAGAYDFIVKKECGFETMIGQGGTTLSGGEKQRISIARAILKNAPIILLDEATSSLDSENELVIQKAISNLIKNKTVVVVAHKLRCVMRANNIVVLKNGKIEEVGKHEELLKNKGMYKQLWDYQEKSRDWKIVQ
ncbi:MAG: ABC transporter ATP-binding protein [[Eubacterium] sulci]|jgi:ABC transporter, permease/ATP-binding protein|nr:ABC transporter ATP-binding protein [[Eubacterium] sulci]MBF1154711.1 ABC transporter ATP-binding protein [[Eubacterium] sulci]MBF1156963.1 ABC transporter ATP-binding protein [[Eubacterium] sulci]MBF1161451.1 ABC transporter ATP-binding protein [[Eubacterium] sulci]MBF1168718.1 ABC transporter ATP-binding protein [[Eubacterium] sulci]